MNAYQTHKGVCPHCGEKLPSHWKSDRLPDDPKDTGFVRMCPSCGQALHCDLSSPSPRPLVP